MDTGASGNPKPRYGTYNYERVDRPEIAVRVTAADFNGRTWDGCPFSAMPDWVRDAFRNGVLLPHTQGSTDYAQWHVVTERGTVNATPGDWIIRRENGRLSVVAEQDAYILINLRPVPPASETEDRG